MIESEKILICTTCPLDECMDQSMKCPLRMINETGRCKSDDANEVTRLIFAMLKQKEKDKQTAEAIQDEISRVRGLKDLAVTRLDERKVENEIKRLICLKDEYQNEIKKLGINKIARKMDVPVSQIYKQIAKLKNETAKQ